MRGAVRQLRHRAHAESFSFRLYFRAQTTPRSRTLLTSRVLLAHIRVPLDPRPRGTLEATSVQTTHGTTTLHATVHTSARRLGSVVMGANQLLQVANCLARGVGC